MKNSNANHAGKDSGEAGSEVRESPEAYSQRVSAAREFAAKWAEAGPVLEELRLLRLQELDDDTPRKMMLDLLRIWQPSEFDDRGAGLVEQQKIFAKLRERESKESRK